jgi:hypothetical protein
MRPQRVVVNGANDPFAHNAVPEPPAAKQSESRRKPASQRGQPVAGNADGGNLQLERLSLASGGSSDTENKRMITLGQNTIKEMSTATRARLLSIPWKDEDQLHSVVGNLQSIKSAPRKVIADRGLLPGHCETITIESLPQSADVHFVIQMLQLLDPTYESGDLVKQILLRDAIMSGEAGGSLERARKSAKVVNFLVTEKAYRIFYGHQECPHALQTLYFRRNLDSLDGHSMELAKQPVMQNIITAAFLVGLSCQDLQEVIHDSLQNSFRQTAMFDTIIAIRIDDKQWKTVTGSGAVPRRVLQAIDFPEGRIQVYFKDQASTRNMQAFGAPMELILGTGPNALRASISLTPTGSRAQSDAFVSGWKEKAIAQAQTAAASTGQSVYEVFACMDVEWTGPRAMTVTDCENKIFEAVGGAMKSVSSVVVSVDAKCRASTHLGVSFYLLEHTDTNFAGDLANLLSASKGAQRLHGAAIANIRLRKGSCKITCLPPPHEPSTAPLSVETTSYQIETHLFNTGPLFIAVKDVDGNPAIMSSADIKQLTPLEKFGLIDRVVKMDGHVFRDLRSVFNGNVTSEILFTALGQMRGRDLFMYGGLIDDDTKNEFWVMFHPLHDPYRELPASRMIVDK